MFSTELSTRILLTVMIVGSLSIDFCQTTATTTTNTNNSNNTTTNDDDDLLVNSSLDSPVSPPTSSLQSSTSPYSYDNEAEVVAQTRLMPDSAEAGILLPYDEDDFPRPGGDGASGDEARHLFAQSVSFPTKPIALRIANGKALDVPSYEKELGKNSNGEEKATVYIRNSCFGPRCAQQQQQQTNNEQILINSPEDWKNVYYNNNNNKEARTKKYDDGVSRSNYVESPTTKYEDNVMESISSNFHSQLAIPFVVVDDHSMKGSQQQSSFSQKSGLADRFSRMPTSTIRSPMTPEGWVKLKAISPDAYDPFRFSKNYSVGGDNNGGDRQSTFTKRDSSSQATTSSTMFSKRVGVELNPESFADRYGWSSNGEHNNNNDNRGGSRLPAWLEEQLKYGNRNSDQGNNKWVKLEPIPVAGVSISKWVPKGTQSQDLPTTSWQTNRDQPNGGSQWWDRIDENRILTGNRQTQFLRPNNNNNNNYNNGGGNNRFNGGNNRYNDGWGSNNKGAPLSSYDQDRFPTNSWNDIIYPDGPTSATVSWQQSKGGISSQPSSFAPSGGGGGNLGGWSTGSSDPVIRKPIATGAWSAPQNNNNNNRFPSFINRFNDRPSSYPTKQVSQDDPRWVLISNTRRVTSGNRGGNELLDRSKVLSYINRLRPDLDIRGLHPDLDRKTDFPFYEPSPTSHRHGKDFWPFQNVGTANHLAPPSKDEAFHRINATLSTLTPILFHRGTTTMRPPIVGTFRPPHPFSGTSHDGSSYNGNNDDLINSISSTLSPLLSTYVGDGRATSSNIANSQQSSSTSTPVRTFFPGKIRQGLKNINPVYAAVGAGMIPATLAAVMPMMLGRRRRRQVANNSFSQRQLKDNRSSRSSSNMYSKNIPVQFRCCITP